MIQVRRLVRLSDGRRVHVHRVTRTVAERIVAEGGRVGVTVGQEFDPSYLVAELPSKDRSLWYWARSFSSK